MHVHILFAKHTSRLAYPNSHICTHCFYLMKDWSLFFVDLISFYKPTGISCMYVFCFNISGIFQMQFTPSHPVNFVPVLYDCSCDPVGIIFGCFLFARCHVETQVFIFEEIIHKNRIENRILKT